MDIVHEITNCRGLQFSQWALNLWRDPTQLIGKNQFLVMVQIRLSCTADQHVLLSQSVVSNNVT